MQEYEAAFRYKLIYVMVINDDAHKGYLKIGETTLASGLGPSQLTPNCDLLNTAAHNRILDYTRTAIIEYELLYTELAVRFVTMKDGTIMPIPFSDHDIHDVLARSGYDCRRFPDTEKNTEWYPVNLTVAVNAIKAFKEYRDVLSAAEKDKGDAAETRVIQKKIVLRQEQDEAVQKALSVFASTDKMLWDCKMRFGKTVSAYELMRRAGYLKTIVVTHRPVVEDGWRQDHDLIFGVSSNHMFMKKKVTSSTYEYDAAIDSENERSLRNANISGAPFAYFTSMQDLRGSKRAGGKFDKNNAVFDIDWDLIIYDEAHEGTQTDLGQSVQTLLELGSSSKKPKVLSLSGTPYNIMGQYEENVYTWDYVSEQRRKKEYADEHPDEYNPYADLPEMRILTFDLHEALAASYRYETEDMAFNFKEFFRTWTGDSQLDFRPIPAGANVGDFVHANDVNTFLDLITHDSENSHYPFSNATYRAMFRHTFWMVPGVKEARALSKMLKEHSVFSSFAIANVAGEGDMEQAYDDALKTVRTTISQNPYSVTISCGRLTTGVTVPEWSAVMMLSGSASTAAAGYMQTIFRVQSVGSIDGKQKEVAYVFDFAPDRALKVISEVHSLTSKGRSGDGDGKAALGEFLNFCPVISVDGTQMMEYDVPMMMRQLKKITVDKAIKSGFDDESIYNEGVGIVMNNEDVKLFNRLASIIHGQPKSKLPSKVLINKHGLDDEQYQKAEKAKNKPNRERTQEEKDAIKKLQEQKKEQEKVIRLLRAVSIRLPMLIYGARVDLNEGIYIGDFIDIVDDESWMEFMPENVTKSLFKQLLKYYDEDVVLGAGLRIRSLARAADELPPTRRVQRIAEIFALFRNPDKETVLTPWRVVNMHMGDTIGGYSFYGDNYANNNILEKPQLIDNGDVTASIISNPEAKILEMNSKSGLYPLYLAYSLYASKLSAEEHMIPLEETQRLWRETLEENIFVLCKTKMARFITMRTLAGYNDDCPVNAIYLSKLLERMDDKARLAKKLRNPMTWGKEGEKMKFDAIIGNPPYQAMLGGASPLPVYHHFVEQAKAVQPRYISMIMPARWFNTGTGLTEFRQEMLTDRRIAVLHDYINATACFPTVEIKGGIVYFLWSERHNDKCKVISHNEDGTTYESIRSLTEPGLDFFVRNSKMITIIEKVREKDEASFSTLISSRDPFGYDIRLPGSYKVAQHQYSLNRIADDDLEFYYNGWRKDGVGYVNPSSVNDNREWVDKHKVLIPKAWGTGKESNDWLNPFLVQPRSVCTETYLVVGPFDDPDEANNAISYIYTKFFHALVAVMKISQNAAQGVYQLVPIQDFTKAWTDAELYDKYDLTKDEIAIIENTIKPE
ncbi:MAG: DEAD/DEAH box helicase [Clostridia bacterium]|nr:DEAD/DEAH box helicase [Clostridia bacterium]